MRAAYHESAGGVDEYLGVRVEKSGGNGGDYDVVYHVSAYLLKLNVCGMLRRNDYCVYSGRLAVVVFHGDLGLSVGAQIGKSAVLADFGKAFRQTVCKVNGKRHKAFGLGAGVAENHTLVAGAGIVFIFKFALFGFQRLVHAQSYVGGLFVDGGDYAAGGGVETFFGRIVADLGDGVPDYRGDIDVRAGGDLAHHEHETRGAGSLARDARRRILGDYGVEHGIGDLVADLIGMPFGYGFGSEKPFYHDIRPFRRGKIKSPAAADEKPKMCFLICRNVHSAELTPYTARPRRLSGFTGQFPPPLLIRSII